MLYRKAAHYGIWLQILLTLGAIASLTTVAITILLTQTRIFYAMAQDGLLPPFFARVNKRTQTPWVSITISGKYLINRSAKKHFSFLF